MPSIEFEITNGRDIIAIERCYLGSYFRIKDPVTLVWDHCRESIGHYLCMLPYDEGQRNEMQQAIQEGLNQDFTGRTDELRNMLSPLFPLFRNGKYRIRYFGFDTGNDPDSATRSFNESIYPYYPKGVTRLEDASVVIAACEEWNKKNEQQREYIYQTDNLYPGDDRYFATRPKEEIDFERVAYFEELIQRGARPFVILYAAPEQDPTLPGFILDGHHKVEAYTNLKLRPPVAVIDQLGYGNEDLFNLERLSTMLFPWQVEHLVENGDFSDTYCDRVLSNPNSPLHKFIKHGDVEEFHPNGTLKMSGTFINNRPDGAYRTWHSNGKPWQEHFYINERKCGIWKDYYPSGKLESVQPFNEMGEYDGRVLSYYESGQMRSEEYKGSSRKAKGVNKRTWHENGNLEYEHTYDGQQMIGNKYHNEEGTLCNNEVYNPSTGRMEQQHLDSLYENAAMMHEARKEKKRAHWGIVLVTLAVILWLLLKLSRLVG